MTHRLLRALRPLVPTVVLPLALFVALGGPTPVSAISGQVLGELFGTGADSRDIAGWDEEGYDNDWSTFAKAYETHGNDSVSPSGGRFAKIIDDEWICREISAAGYENLTLSYFWRGDSDSHDYQDDGIVEVKDGSGSCDSTHGWTIVRNHDLRDDGSWSEQSAFALPDELDNGTFRIRFRADMRDNEGNEYFREGNEYFRVDGVTVSGSPIAETTPSAVITIRKDLNGTAREGEAFEFALTDTGDETFGTATLVAPSPTPTAITVPFGAEEVGPRTVVLTETGMPSGWRFDSVVCQREVVEVVGIARTTLATTSERPEETPLPSISPTPEPEFVYGDRNATFKVRPGDRVTCTFLDTKTGGGSSHGTLAVEKVIVGGSAVPADFSFMLGDTVNPFEADGSNEYVLPAATYQVTEAAAVGYTTTYGGDCDASGVVAVPANGSVRCVITNTSTEPEPTPEPEVQGAQGANPQNLKDNGLQDGDLIRAEGDPDVYVVNQYGYKRLFVNPTTFSRDGKYKGWDGTVKGWTGVKLVTPEVRDLFPTSALVRNCAGGDAKVYAVEVTGEDTATLHWVNLTDAEAVAQDPDFFAKVFCITPTEFGWYEIAEHAITSLADIPAYKRE